MRARAVEYQIQKLRDEVKKQNEEKKTVEREVRLQRPPVGQLN